MMIREYDDGREGRRWPLIAAPPNVDSSKNFGPVTGASRMIVSPKLIRFGYPTSKFRPY